MIFHLLAMFGRSRTYIQIKAFQKSFNLAKKTGKMVLIPSRPEKILIVIAHVVADADNADAEKLQRIIACIDAVNSSLASYSYQIVLLSKKGYSLQSQLPDHMRDHVQVHYSTQADPMHVEFDAFEIFRSKASDFDYFLFLEDDIILNDSWFLNKIKLFNHVSPYPEYVLLPHRFEYDKGKKYYLDQVAVHDKVSETYSYSETLKVSFDDLQFCFYENPHAAFYCLNKQQLQLWIASGYQWKNKVVAFGPLESAATFSLFENFKFMKPHPTCVDYFEVRHFGNKYMLSNKITQ